MWQCAMLDSQYTYTADVGRVTKVSAGGSTSPEFDFQPRLTNYIQIGICSQVPTPLGSQYREVQRAEVVTVIWAV